MFSEQRRHKFAFVHDAHPSRSGTPPQIPTVTLLTPRGPRHHVGTTRPCEFPVEPRTPRDGYRPPVPHAPHKIRKPHTHDIIIYPAHPRRRHKHAPPTQRNIAVDRCQRRGCGESFKRNGPRVEGVRDLENLLGDLTHRDVDDDVSIVFHALQGKMKRGRSYDDDDDFDDDSSLDDYDYPRATDQDETLPTRNHENVDITVFSARDAEDRPIALTDVGHHPFDWKPATPYRDPMRCLYEGHGVTITPCGLTLELCFANLANAIHFRDEANAAIYITEAFRTFVYANQRVCFFPPSSLEPQVLMEEWGSVGPFSSIVSWGLHQRIRTELLTLFTDQVGVADPVAILAIETLWKSYERFLFILPMVALSKLLAITNVLCHAHKDSSVPILRDVCEDTASARAWRSHATSPTGIHSLHTLMSRTDADRSLSLLRVSDVYFTTRLRLDLYARVACTTPHPIYLAQAGAMRAKFVTQLVDGIRQDIGGETSVPSSIVTLVTIEDIMLTLTRHVNNAVGRERWSNLQEALQVVAFMLRLTAVTPGIDVADLFDGSERHIAAAPVCITEDYARTFFRTIFRHRMLTREAVVASEAPSSAITSRSRVPVMTDLLRAFTDRPRAVRFSPIHGIITLPATGVLTWRDGISTMANDLLRPLWFLRWLYLFKVNNKKIDKAITTDTTSTTIDTECDGDVFDVSTAKPIGDSTFAFEVELTGRGASLLTKTPPPTTSATPTTTVPVPQGVAGSLVDILTRTLSDGGPPTVKAVVLWNRKSAIHTTRRIVLHTWPFDMGDGATLGRAYDWTIIPFDKSKVAMRLGDLLETTRRFNVPRLFAACTKPTDMATLLVTMEKTHALTNTQDHYVSFHIAENDSDTHDASVLVSNVVVHAISWAPRASPDPIVTEKIDKLAAEKPRLAALIEELRR